jgi:hypothetical protein
LFVGFPHKGVVLAAVLLGLSEFFFEFFAILQGGFEPSGKEIAGFF